MNGYNVFPLKELTDLAKQSNKEIADYFLSVNFNQIKCNSPNSIEITNMIISLMSRVLFDNSIHSEKKNEIFEKHISFIYSVIRGIKSFILSNAIIHQIIIMLDSITSFFISFPINSQKEIASRILNELVPFLSTIKLLISDKDKDDYHLYHKIYNKAKIALCYIEKDEEKKEEEFDNHSIEQNPIIPNILNQSSKLNAIPIEENKKSNSYKEYINKFYTFEYALCYRELCNSIYKIRNKINIPKANRYIKIYNNVSIRNISSIDSDGIKLALHFSPEEKINYSRAFKKKSLISIYDNNTHIFLSIVSYNPYSMSHKEIRESMKDKIIVQLIDNSIESINNLIISSNNPTKLYTVIEEDIYYMFSVNKIKRFTKMLSQSISLKRSIVYHDYCGNFELPFKNVSNVPDLIDKEQSDALSYIINSRVSVVLGDVGTGKTFLAAVCTKYFLYNTNYRMLVLSNTRDNIDKYLSYFVNYSNSFIRLGGNQTNNNFKIKDMTIKAIKNRDNFETNTAIINTEIRQEKDKIYNIFNKNSSRYYNKYKVRYKNEIEQIIDDLLHIINSIDERYYYIKEDYLRYEELIFHVWSGRKPIEDVLSLFSSIKKENYELIKQDQFENFEKEDEEEEKILPACEEQPKENGSNDFSIDSMEFNNNNPISNDDFSEMNYFVNLSNNNKEEITKEALSAIFEEHNVWELGPSLRKKIIHFMFASIFSLTKEDQDTLHKYFSLINRKKEIEKEDDIKAILSRRVVTMYYDTFSDYLEHIDKFRYDVIIIDNAETIKEKDFIPFLTSNLKHLILFGNREQLPLYNKIEKTYQFHISILNELIENDFPYYSLSRTKEKNDCDNYEELILSYLRKDSAVKENEIKIQYGNVRYIIPDRFIVTHKYPKDHYYLSINKTNEYEAKFIIGLANFLIDVAHYSPSQITIVALTDKQVEIIKSQKSIKYKDIQIYSVFDAGFRENDIILVSISIPYKNKTPIPEDLFYSFGKYRLGVFAIGNIDYLISNERNKRIPKDRWSWKALRENANENQIIGDSLPMVCKNHSVLVNVHSLPDLQMIANCRSIHKKMNVSSNSQDNTNNTNNITKNIKENSIDNFNDMSHIKKENESFVNDNDEIIIQLNIQNKTIPLIQRKEQSFANLSDLDSKLIPPCGHNIHYHLFNSNYYTLICTFPCDTLLKCGHKCKGNCSQCMMGTLHIQCTSECKKELICGHQCIMKCGELCKCTNDCLNKHFESTFDDSDEHKVYDIQCPKYLICGHQCQGLEGEKCPNICRFCNPNEGNITFLFGNEKQDDSLFYMLSCGHCFEVSGLDEYMLTSVNKKCPKCLCVIEDNGRYKHLINERNIHINKILNDIQSQIKPESIKKKFDELFNGLNTEMKQQFRQLIPLEKQKDKLIDVYYCLTIYKKFSMIEKEFYNRLKSIDEEYSLKLYTFNYWMIKEIIKQVPSFTLNYYRDFEKKINNVYIFTISKNQEIVQTIVESNFFSDEVNKQFVLNDAIELDVMSTLAI